MLEGVEPETCKRKGEYPPTKMFIDSNCAKNYNSLWLEKD